MGQKENENTTTVVFKVSVWRGGGRGELFKEKSGVSGDQVFGKHNINWIIKLENNVIKPA